MTLPIPSFYQTTKVGDIFNVDYPTIQQEAESVAERYNVKPWVADHKPIALVAVDMQITFANFDLPVAGAFDDARRVCEFIYKYADKITKIYPTMDTHFVSQIFFGIFWVDRNGKHPAPFTNITVEDVETGVWRVNPKMAFFLADRDANGNAVVDYTGLQEYAKHYVRTLKNKGRHALVVWPPHGRLMGITHALIPSLAEAIEYHSVVRSVLPQVAVKGTYYLTENYAVTGPEVLTGPNGEVVGEKDVEMLEVLATSAAVLFVGEAKSHCLAWSAHSAFEEFIARDPNMAKKIYIMEDCTSDVGGNPTPESIAIFDKMRCAGVNFVTTATPMEDWPNMQTIFS